MIVALGVLVGVGIILSILTGPIGLAITVPAALALLWLLRKRQPDTPVDQRYLGGPQPEHVGGRDDPSQANPH